MSAGSPNRRNGASTNPRYVAAKMAELEEYMTKVTPLMEDLVAAAALDRPSDVRGYLAERLRSGPVKRDVDEDSTLDSKEAEAWLSENVQPIVADLVRQLALKQPDDPRSFCMGALTMSVTTSVGPTETREMSLK